MEPPYLQEFCSWTSMQIPKTVDTEIHGFGGLAVVWREHAWLLQGSEYYLKSFLVTLSLSWLISQIQAQCNTRLLRRWVRIQSKCQRQVPHLSQAQSGPHPSLHWPNATEATFPGLGGSGPVFGLIEPAHWSQPQSSQTCLMALLQNLRAGARDMCQINKAYTGSFVPGFPCQSRCKSKLLATGSVFLAVSCLWKKTEYHLHSFFFLFR